MDKSLACGRKIQKFKPRCHLRGITIPGGKLRFYTPRRPVIEFQQGIEIVQGDAYHVINQAAYPVPLRRFQLSCQAENLKISPTVSVPTS